MPESPTNRPDDVHERPEVKPIVEKAGAGKADQPPPPGTMKTGSDTAGGGGTISLDVDDRGKPVPPGTPDINKG